MGRSRGRVCRVCRVSIQGGTRCAVCYENARRMHRAGARDGPPVVSTEDREQRIVRYQERASRNLPLFSDAG